MKMTSAPGATSCAELYVADGFNFANKNLACSVTRRIDSRLSSKKNLRKIIIAMSPFKPIKLLILIKEVLGGIYSILQETII